MEKELFYKRNSATNDSANKLKYHIWKFVDHIYSKQV